MCILGLTKHITELEEEQQEILNKVSVAKRLAMKCILDRIALEKIVQTMETLFRERGRQNGENLNYFLWEWRSEVDDLLHMCQVIEEDKTRETLVHDMLSEKIDRLQNQKYESL
jgi:hypothetical protein